MEYRCSQPLGSRASWADSGGRSPPTPTRSHPSGSLCTRPSGNKGRRPGRSRRTGSARPPPKQKPLQTRQRRLAPCQASRFLIWLVDRSNFQHRLFQHRLMDKSNLFKHAQRTSSMRKEPFFVKISKSFGGVRLSLQAVVEAQLQKPNPPERNIFQFWEAIRRWRRRSSSGARRT